MVIFPRFQPLFCLFCAGLALFSTADALQVRDGNTADNQRFTGNLSSPSSLSANPSFFLSGFDTTGIGWNVQDTRRQFAMISPQHFVCATHFRPASSGQVRFMGSDGQIYTYEIRQTQIISDANGNTDLSLGTLEEAVDTSVITPFRYADFAQESSYSGTAFVFGRTALAGETTLGAVVSLSDLDSSVSASFDNTRFLLSSYQNNSGNNNDAFLEGGDSGSPSFLNINGELTLLATNSLISNGDDFRLSFASFIPHYVNELNALMADEGFQISSHNPTNTNLSATQESITTTLREAHPGSITLTLTNTGNNRANNIEVRLNQLNTSPSSISGPDFTTRIEGADTLVINRAFLDPNESALLTLIWDALPTGNPFSFEASIQSDESSESLLQISEATLPSFLQFVSEAATPDEEGDDDRDGLGNLLEYALGGDLEVASTVSAEGVHLGIVVSGPSNTIRVDFQRRTDAAQRGLTYALYSGETFPLTNPVDLSSATVTSSPDLGFELVSVTLPQTASSQMFILGVTLDEEVSAP